MLRKLINIIVLIILTGTFTSCITEQKCAIKFPPVVNTNTKIILKDTSIFVYVHDTIKIVGDTVKSDTNVVVTHNIANSKEIIKYTKYAIAKAKVSNNKLNLMLIQRDSAIARLVKAKVTVVTKYKIKTETKIKTKYIKHWYDKISNIIALLTIVVVLGFIAFKVLKIATKITLP